MDIILAFFMGAVFAYFALKAIERKDKK